MSTGLCLMGEDMGWDKSVWSWKGVEFMEIATEATGAHTKGELQAGMISRTGFLLCSHCLEDEASPWLVHSHSEDN